jgi:hypothetical protein
MTRAERRAERERKLKAKIEAGNKALAQLLANNRAQARAERDKRRYKIGATVDEAGLFVWDDMTLTSIVQILTKLLDCPDPVAVLESLVADQQGIVAAVQD